MAAFTAAERQALAEALAGGGEPECPSCGGVLSVGPVARPRQVSYVRHRRLVVCTACKRSAAVEVAKGADGHGGAGGAAPAAGD